MIADMPTVILTGDLSILLDMLEDIEGEQVDPTEYEGWYCIQHQPIRCLSCGEFVCYVEPPQYHLIVVWETKDHEDMLRLAGKIEKLGYDPIVIQYSPIMGNCIPYDEVKKII